MNSYEWMVKYTSQTEWIKGGGMLVWLSFYAGILGSGSYLVSLYFNNLLGMLVSWLIIVVIKNGFHMAHAKRPMRMWRMILRPKSSWLSRGTIFIGLFTGCGFIQLILSYLLPGTPAEITFKLLTGIAVCAVLLYEGFTLNYIKGIPFWNSALLPVLFIFWGLLSGLALIATIGWSGADSSGLAAGNQLFLIATIILTVLYMWSASYAGAAAQESVKIILQGNLSLIFGVGAVLLGMIIPLIIWWLSSVVGQTLAVTILVCEIIGGLAFTYSVFKAGVYSPIISNDWR